MPYLLYYSNASSEITAARLLFVGPPFASVSMVIHCSPLSFLLPATACSWLLCFFFLFYADSLVRSQSLVYNIIKRMALQENHKSQVMQTYGLTAVQETAQNSSSIIDDDYSDDLPDMPGRRSGKRKIKIEYIDEKSRRHITFSKRKAGIMKKVCVQTLMLARVYVLMDYLGV